MNRRPNRWKPHLLKLLVLPPIVLGLVVLVVAIKNRRIPEKIPESELARTLRVITVEPMAYRPRAIGFGTARPSQFWTAVAEVKGRIVELNPDLKSGTFVKGGTLLVRIDPTDTNLAIGRLEAEIAKVESSIAELNASEKNLQASARLELDALEVAERELARVERLAESGAGARAEVDANRRAVLGQRQKVQNIASSLNLLPAQIQAAQASLLVSQANLAEKKRDLERIEIKAPFDCRIGPVNLELHQFLGLGELLFEVQSTDRVEIEAQVAVRQIRKLFDEERRQQDVDAGNTQFNDQIIQRYFDVDVIVRYAAGSNQMQRTAELERFREELDNQTRTVGVVVSIQDPFKTTIKGPPPVSGTYCEVELLAKPQPNAIIVPRAAIWNEHVYVLDGDQRLRRRKISVAQTQSEFAVIASGLEAGETLIASDPTPAVEGMLVEPVEDTELSEMLRRQASGEGALR